MKKFTHRNEAFICDNCGENVPPADKTCRNHCPFCLHSKHVDCSPGDRQNPCQGILQPVGLDYSGSKGWIIEFRCTKCRELLRNKCIQDGESVPDAMEVLVALSKPGLS